MRRRWVEYSLLLAGLIALDLFVWLHARAVMSQAYESWSFEQDLRGEPASVAGYLRDQWDRLLGNMPGRTPERSEQHPDKTFSSTTPASPAPPHVAERSVIGRVEIPRLSLSEMIREGADSGTLSLAVGHIPSTSLPGQPGNVALAAHRDTYFLPLEHIRNGDRIQIETRQGRFEYVVESTQVVMPRDVWVLKATDHRTLTLVTCFPFRYIGAAPKRFIVRAAQVGDPSISSPPPSSS